MQRASSSIALCRCGRLCRRVVAAFALSVSLTTGPASFAEDLAANPQSVGMKAEVGRDKRGKDHRFEELAGKRIGDIKIEIRDIFDDPSQGEIYRMANELKMSTREEVVRRELLFKAGDQLDPFLLRESERSLRTLRYLRNIEIKPLSRSGDPAVVDIVITVQDTWTLIPQLGFSTGVGSKKTSVGIVESDLFGYGKRVETSYSQDEKRETLEALYDDNRFMGWNRRLTAGYLDRSDGQISLFSFERPFRSLVDKTAWSFKSYDGDFVGRLFENATEDYIYRENRTELNARYTMAFGDPEIAARRFSVGYDYLSETFEQATASDYDDVDLDPSEVSNDLDRLAEDRRFTGPVLTYEVIKPDYIQMNYIDRFDRVEDYNLGAQYSVSSFIAPTALGSREDAYLFSGNRSHGWRIDRSAFMRGEAGISTRVESTGFANTLLRAESRYYDVLGDTYIKGMFLGKHTFAGSLFIDYGIDLDRDREFLLGGDNAVRGYKQRTFSGNKRLAVNIEDRMHFAEDVFRIVSVGGAIFLEGGAASDHALGRMVQDDFYSDVGFGLRLAFPRSSGSQVFRIDIAFPLRDGPDGSGQFEPRLILAGGQIFSSRMRSETTGTERANTSVGFER